MKRAVQVILLTTALLTFMGAGDDNARFNELGHKLMCACGCGQILLECNHVGCTYSDRMRGELAAAIDRGENDDLALQSFVQKYGPTVLAAPPTTGFNRVAWVMPFVALVFGIGLTVLIVRAWRSRPAALPSGVAQVTGPEFDAFRKKAREETEV